MTRALAATLLDRIAPFHRGAARLPGRRLPTNRLTLIAAIVPAGVVTTHTLFCLKTICSTTTRSTFLCGLFNSFVANYLVRLRVSTHVTASIVERLPVPRPARDSPAFVEIACAQRADWRRGTRHDGAGEAAGAGGAALRADCRRRSRTC